MLDGEFVLVQARHLIRLLEDGVEQLTAAQRRGDDAVAEWWAEGLYDAVRRQRKGLLVRARQRAAAELAVARVGLALRPALEAWGSRIGRLKSHVHRVLGVNRDVDAIRRLRAYEHVEATIGDADDDVAAVWHVGAEDSAALDQLMLHAPGKSAPELLAQALSLSPWYIRQAVRLSRRLAGVLPTGHILAHARRRGPRQRHP